MSCHLSLGRGTLDGKTADHLYANGWKFVTFSLASYIMEMLCGNCSVG